MTEIENNLDFIMSKLSKLGVSEAIAKLEISHEFQHRFANNVITISKSWESVRYSVFVAVDSKVASQDIQTNDKNQIEQILENMVNRAKKSEPLPFFKGLNPDKYTPSQVPSLYDSKILDYVEKSGEHVNMAIETARKQGAKRSAGVFQFGLYEVFAQSSHGIEYNYKKSFYDFNIRSFIEFESSGQGLVSGVKINEIEDRIAKAADHAGRLAFLSKDPKMGTPGQYDVILSPIVAANLFGMLGSAANPLFIMMNFSPYGDKMGKQIAPEFINVYDWGNIEEGLGSRPVDFEGVATQKTTILDKGVLKNLIHNYSTAKLMGAKSTGNSELANFDGNKFLAPIPSNIVFENGDHTLEELMEIESENNRPIIYVTSNWYTRWTNMLETSFSTIPRDGMYIIKNGEISQPVKKLRISDNLIGMTQRIQAMGNDRQQIHWWEVETPTFIGSVRVANVRFTAATK